MQRLYYILIFFLIVPFGITGNPRNPVRIFLKENRLDEASAVCRQHEVLASTDSDTMLACAWVYFRSNQLAQAEKTLDQLKKFSPLPEYQMLNAYSKVKRKQFDLADGLFENLIQEHKGTLVAHQCTALRGEIKEMRGQLPSAAFIYTSVVRDDPENGHAHWALGRHYKDRGDIRLAIQHLEKTAKLWPKHVQSRYELAMLYLENGGTDSLNDASRWLGEAYKINKNDPAVLEQLGLAFEKKGMISEAVKYWQRAVELKKDLKFAPGKLQEHFAQSIDVLIETKKWKEALVKLDGAGKAFNDLPKSILKRGIILRNLGQYDKALAELQRYSKMNPNEALPYLEQGICHVNAKQLEQAYAMFGKAIVLEPDNGLPHAWLAFILEAKGEWENARIEWKRAVETLKDPAELHKANRKLASIEKKISKREKELKQENE